MSEEKKRNLLVVHHNYAVDLETWNIVRGEHPEDSLYNQCIVYTMLSESVGVDKASRIKGRFSYAKFFEWVDANEDITNLKFAFVQMIDSAPSSNWSIVYNTDNKMLLVNRTSNTWKVQDITCSIFSRYWSKAGICVPDSEPLPVYQPHIIKALTDLETLQYCYPELKHIRYNDLQVMFAGCNSADIIYYAKAYSKITYPLINNIRADQHIVTGITSDGYIQQVRFKDLGHRASANRKYSLDTRALQSNYDAMRSKYHISIVTLHDFRKFVKLTANLNTYVRDCLSGYEDSETHVMTDLIGNLARPTFRREDASPSNTFDFVEVRLGIIQRGRNREEIINEIHEHQCIINRIVKKHLDQWARKEYNTGADQCKCTSLILTYQSELVYMFERLK